MTTEVIRPTGARVRIPLTPPEGMRRQEFACQLVARARDFSSHVSPYSAPQNIRGARMRPGEYNSSPMPGHDFKGEAIR